MDWKIENLVRDNIKSLVPYSSARDDYSGHASVFLDANESPYNPPLNRYPDPHQKELKRSLSRLKGIPEENIFLGNGSDEAIDLLYRIFCEPGQSNAVIMDPSYGMYAVSANINHVEVRKVLLNKDFTLDPDRLLSNIDEQTGLVFLCSPNNPTSNLLDQTAVLKVIESSSAIVVIDEAYIEFSGSEGFSAYIEQFPNLVVLQTLSKAWALAGIRLGMALADKAIINYMTKVKYPYNINSLTISRAIEELQDLELRTDWMNDIISERMRMSRVISQLPCVEHVHPSDANFLLVKFNDPKEIYDDLLNNGIIVRDRSAVPLCQGCLRITIGTKQENDLLIDFLTRKQIMKSI